MGQGREGSKEGGNGDMGWRITLAMYLLIAIVYGGCIEATALNDSLSRIPFTVIVALAWPIIAMFALFRPFIT